MVEEIQSIVLGTTWGQEHFSVVVVGTCSHLTGSGSREREYWCSTGFPNLYPEKHGEFSFIGFAEF